MRNNPDFRMRSERPLRLMDPVLTVLYLAISVIGILVIRSASMDQEVDRGFWEEPHIRQMVWLFITLIPAVVILAMDGSFFFRMAIPLYIISMVLLVVVMLFGVEINGARSWFRFGPVALQPSEFAKTAASLALAAVCASLDQDAPPKTLLRNAVGILLLPFLLVILQGDFGSALVFMAIGLCLIRENVPLSLFFVAFLFLLTSLFALVTKPWVLVLWVLGLGLVALLYTRMRGHSSRVVLLSMVVLAVWSQVVPFAYNVLAPHQKERIDVVLGKGGDDWNLLQSKIAIGSGKWIGKGYAKGTQTKFDFVPEQNTDFIFSTVGEEGGLLGSIGLLMLFAFLIARIIAVAERQRSHFSRSYGYAIASILLFHVFINVGMTMGLVPVIGIPLPLISYGGSSFLSFSIMIIIFIRLDMGRKQSLALS
ncbi:MAG: rod shape-determining protein RodA [Chitinophagales bacterium]